jgi:hypothetical protein
MACLAIKWMLWAVTRHLSFHFFAVRHLNTKPGKIFLFARDSSVKTHWSHPHSETWRNMSWLVS